MTFELAKILEDYNYPSSINGLKDWNLLRYLEIKSTELNASFYSSFRS